MPKTYDEDTPLGGLSTKEKLAWFCFTITWAGFICGTFALLRW